MVTVVSLVFSITIVTLTLASQQFGPLLLRTFMERRSTQVVLAIFVATAIYCLLVACSIHTKNGVPFVPSFAILAGIGLVLIGLGSLVFFLHRVAVAIQAPSIVEHVASGLETRIEELFPKKIDESGTTPEPVRVEDIVGVDRLEDGRPIHGDRPGYVQAIEVDRLVETARKEDLVIALEKRAGDFVFRGERVATIWFENSSTHHRTEERILAAILVGHERTPIQDVEFSMMQLVQVAARALSPGINDPFTAKIALDRLASAVGQLAERRFPTPPRRDSQGRVRLFVPVVTFADVVSTAFDEIRDYGASHLRIAVRMLDLLRRIAPWVRRESDRRVLLSRAALLFESAERELRNDAERARVEDLYRRAVEALAGLGTG